MEKFRAGDLIRIWNNRSPFTPSGIKNRAKADNIWKVIEVLPSRLIIRHPDVSYKRWDQGIDGYDQHSILLAQSCWRIEVIKPRDPLDNSYIRE